MAIDISKRASGGYTLVYDEITVYPSEIKYFGNSNGVFLFATGLNFTKYFEPADWTIATVTGFTTVTAVCDALDALGLVAIKTQLVDSSGVSSNAMYRTFTKTITRPANTTAYTAADVIGDVSEALDSFADVAKAAGYGVCITNVRLFTTDTGLSGKTIRVHFFKDSVTAIADNAAFAMPDGTKSRGYVEVIMGTGNLATEGQSNVENLIINPVARLIPFIPETTEGFTPSANSTTLRFDIGCILSN